MGEVHTCVVSRKGWLRKDEETRKQGYIRVRVKKSETNNRCKKGWQVFRGVVEATMLRHHLDCNQIILTFNLYTNHVHMC